jgi:hypothetical protein
LTDPELCTRRREIPTAQTPLFAVKPLTGRTNWARAPQTGHPGTSRGGIDDAVTSDGPAARRIPRNAGGNDANLPRIAPSRADGRRRSAATP